MFQHVEPYAGDPILTLNEQFQADPRAQKINLSIGIYFDDQGRLPLMKAVQAAETELLSQLSPRSYLPMSGDPAYRQAVQQLLFGPDSEAVQSQRIATIQTLGGSGALKIGGDFIKRYFPQSQVWVSDPTWDNHRALLEGCGLTVHTYPYYDPDTGGLRFDDMLATLQTLPRHSVVLLHACCHNPTGVDLNDAQWRQIIPLLRERELIAFVDIAYQGFGDGLQQDTQALRALVDGGVICFVANSFSKNFSLYGERVGGLSVVCPDAAQAQLVLGQLMACVRRVYSSPPVHGAKIVTRVLNTPSLRQQWEDELAQMCTRMHAMRQSLHQVLQSRIPGRNFDYFLTQRGMFSYTGLSPEQVEKLRQDFGVYILRSGRMCVAGLNTHNVQAVAHAMSQVL